MQYLIYIYPALISLVGRYCYKRDGALMQRFYLRMTLSQAARRLFIQSLLMLELIFNFWYLQAFGIDIPLVIGTALCAVMFSFRTTERILHGIQSANVTMVAFIAMLTCVVFPDLWMPAMCLYMLWVVSLFYPSRNLLRRLASPGGFSKAASSTNGTLIKDYYSR